MNIFAEASNTVSDPVLIATIAFFGTLIAGLFKIIQNQTKANEELTRGIGKLAENSDKNAKNIAAQTRELKRGNVEAKERNGHLGEQTEKIARLIIQRSQNVKEQNVENQIVNHVEEAK